MPTRKSSVGYGPANSPRGDVCGLDVAVADADADAFDGLFAGGVSSHAQNTTTASIMRNRRGVMTVGIATREPLANSPTGNFPLRRGESGMTAQNDGGDDVDGATAEQRSERADAKS